MTENLSRQEAAFVLFTVYFFPYICNPKVPKARVAKLVDALSSGGSVRKDVLVRIQSRAQSPAFGGVFYFYSNHNPSLPILAAIN